MNPNEILLQDLPDPFAPEMPCCEEELALDDVAQELPEPAALQQELDLLAEETDTQADDLLFADLGMEEVTFQEELELAGLEQQPLPPLEGILEIAERYPGLKVTFSF